MSLLEIERFTLEDCQPYVQTAATKWLVLTRYGSAFMTLILFGFGVRNAELYLMLFSAVLSYDWLSNWALVAATQSPVPVATCGGPFGMPSFQSQHSACFVTFLLTHGYVWPKSRPTSNRLVAALLVWLGLVVYADSYLNYHSPTQTLVGVAVGSLNGFLGQMAIYRWLWPRFGAILQWRIMRWRGYTDTLCSCCTTDLGASPQTPVARASRVEGTDPSDPLGKVK